MTEYRVEMQLHGRWIGARLPNGRGCRILQTKDEAFAKADQLMLTWEAYKNAHMDYIWFNGENCPVNFRVASREVTEWVEL